MKKFAFVFAALAACFAISCTKEVANDAPQGGMQTVTVTASVEQMTKTAYDAEGNFAWHKGDQISILGSDKIFYTFTATEAGATATFTGVLPEGITLRKEAYSPADAGHHRDGDNWFFSVAEYKDLTATGSADLPMGAYLEPGNYVFRHITGAALFTFTDIPEGIEAVEIAFSHGVQLSGEFQSWTGSDDAGKFWVYGAHNAAEETTQGSYVRKVSVVENTAKVYLPYPTDGKIWAGLHVSVTGFNAAGEEVVLLEDLATIQTIDEMPRATVIPVEPISLAAEEPELVWEKYDLPVGASSSRQVLRSIEYTADANNLYVKLEASASLFTEKNVKYLGVMLFDVTAGTEGAGYWGWWNEAVGNVEFNEEHAGQFTGTDLALTIDGVEVNVVKEETAESVFWTLPIPRSAHAVLAGSEVNMGFLVMEAWEPCGAMPDKYGDMLKVVLP